MAELVTIDDVRAAAARLSGVAVRTPIEQSRALSEIAGREVVLKCEHLQRTGSFKIRGAYNRIAQLSAAQGDRGVACASAGNHAQGVALSAHLAGIRATVFMPQGAPLPKVEATRAYGAEVVLVPGSFEDSVAACDAWAASSGAEVVPPYEHPDVIAGQGTVALELAEQVPDMGTVVAAVGGGGLLAGVGAALRALRPDVRLVGVRAAGAARGATIADGIAVREPGALASAHLRAHVDEMIAVSDESIARAVLLLAERAKQMVEPAGAAPAAAALDGALASLPGPVVLVLGGGNVDPLLLLRILRSGMGEEGRTWTFRTHLPDRPGALSALLAVIGEAGANVVAVEHHRYGVRYELDQVEVYLELETRGPGHIQRLRAALADGGYALE